MRILGINFGHNGTIAVLEDGKIMFCQSEERINRIKNSYGFPYETLKYIKNKYYPIDLAVFNFSWPYFFAPLKENNFQTFRYIDDFKKTRPLNLKNLLQFILWKFNPILFAKILKYKNRKHISKLNDLLEEERDEYFSKLLELDKSKIIYLNHHIAHALSVCFNLNSNKKTLIFTADESGDGICATVSIYENYELKTILEISDEFSIGAIWHIITGFLGLKPLEDEYKIMGLAPYAKFDKAREVADQLHFIFKLNDKGEFETILPTFKFNFWLYDKFLYERFDNLAGGIQLFTEEIICNWIKYWINKTGIRDIALSGGLFMNVKLNQRISELKEVESIFIMPSAGDESATIGCCFYGYKKYCEENNLPFNSQPFTHLYLGLEYSNEDIKKTIKDLKLESKYKVKFYEDIEKEVAKLLAQNEIVARFYGVMEFGARALGNRSILSNPSNYDNVRIINEMIKQRDFWMPFACSILEEDQHEYIENLKNIYAPYMIITFNTTEKGRKELKAGIHPYDFTIRPQIVRKEWNPQYHYLISEFKKITGISGILNTSFNLHGEPLVCSPEDAVSTFERSGLKYLALGNYLISKNE